MALDIQSTLQEAARIAPSYAYFLHRIGESPTAELSRLFHGVKAKLHGEAAARGKSVEAINQERIEAGQPSLYRHKPAAREVTKNNDTYRVINGEAT